jgi:hypothetical protein
MKITKLVFLLPIFFLFAGCISIKPVSAFWGEEIPVTEIATINYTGDLNSNLLVFKVDSKTNPSPDSYLWTYNSKPTGELKLQLMPGRHILEVCLNKAKAVKLLAFDCEAGRKYFLKRTASSVELLMAIEGKRVAVPFEISDVPFFHNVAEGEPHATITEVPGQGSAVIYRIDGHPGETSYRFHIYYGEKQPIFVTPGTHEIDYSGYMEGQRYQNIVHTVAYTFEAGKTYGFASSIEGEISGFELMSTTIHEVE